MTTGPRGKTGACHATDSSLEYTDTDTDTDTDTQTRTQTQTQTQI